MNIFQKCVCTIMLMVATLFVTQVTYAFTAELTNGNNVSKFDVESFRAKDFSKFDALVAEEASRYNADSFCKENFTERMYNYAPQEINKIYRSKNLSEMQKLYLTMKDLCSAYNMYNTPLHATPLSDTQNQIENMKKLDDLASKAVILHYGFVKIWHFYAWQNTPDPEEREKLKNLLSKYDDLHPREIEQKLSSIIQGNDPE